MSTVSPKLKTRESLKLKYSSGIAPMMTAKQYANLIAEYKKSGPSVFPHIMKLGGMAIDTSQNRNKWRVPLTDLHDVAAQLKGAPLMKDHDIDHVDSIIGKVEEAWVEEDGQGGGKVMWEGECSDKSLIEKILLGYVKSNSIQIAVPQAYCDNCITHLGRKEEEAALDNLDFPCPRCGSLEMIARHPGVLEQSIVAIPAYPNADVAPYGFKAALDNLQEKRIENAQKAGWHLQEGKTVAPKSSAPNLMPLVIKAFNAVANVEVAVLETQVRLLAAEFEEEGVLQSLKLKPNEGANWCPDCKGLGRFPISGADCQSCGGTGEVSKTEMQEEAGECPECGGPLAELGSLGSKTWYRCQNCGMDSSSEGVSDDEGMQEEIHRQSRVPSGTQHALERMGGESELGAPESEIQNFPLAEKPAIE